MFDQQELQMIVGGTESDIDIEDLRAHCNVTGFPDDTTIHLFWKVVNTVFDGLIVRSSNGSRKRNVELFSAS